MTKLTLIFSNQHISYKICYIFRQLIGAKWFGFTDPQSGLSHFTWRVGTAPLGDDIVSSREVHLNEIAVIPDTLQTLYMNLPVNRKLFSTIRAYNKAGLIYLFISDIVTLVSCSTQLGVNF